MLKIIGIAAATLAVVIAVVVIYASTQPDQFRVQRSASIKASPATIFPLINDLRTFNSWNPFDKNDPNARGSYSGPASGQGAAYAFEGGKSGTGTIQIVETAPPSRVTMALIMMKPIHADNRVDFTLEPQGETTRVTWAMDGEVPLVGKVLHLFINMDKMVGGQFEAGLADLKTLAEKSSPQTG